MTIRAWGHAIAYLAYAAEFGGFAAGVSRWGRLTRPLQAITLWFGVQITVDVVAAIVAPIWRTTQPIEVAALPFTVVLALEALASYQRNGAVANRFRLAGAAYVLAWIGLHFFVERTSVYSTYAEPLSAVTILVGAVVVLYQRVAWGRTDTLSDAAFLIAAGLCGVQLATVFKTLVAQLFYYNSGYTIAFYSACNVVAVLFEILMIRALMLEGPVRRRDGPGPV